jgi:DNA-directed RNA polymerase subunit RPC12/RpoP
LPGAKTILSYRAPGSDGLVKVARYADPIPAELDAAALAAEGIPARVFGANVSSLGLIYQGFNSVELHVRAEDFERAAKVLARVSSTELEPADAGPTADDQGRPLLPAAAFDNSRSLYDAQAVLASASIQSFAPILVPRGDKPPGVGARFVLRVSAQDLPRAQALLREDPDSDDPRCPKCGSWRVFAITHFWKDLGAAVGLGPKSPSQSECLACKYCGKSDEFVRPRSL